MTPEQQTPGLKFPDLLLYRGYHAPSRVEGEVYDCEVEGTLPAALDGAYFRCCADTRYPPMLGDDVFINGDGMLHKVRLENGHADLSTRYVRTERYLLESQARRALYGAYRNPYSDAPEVQGKDRGTANTTAFFHHGQLYALKEDSPPMRINPANLDTLGYWNFNGALTSKTFTAHPKIDPDTGECIAFSYNSSGKQSNLVEIYWIAKDGQLTRTEVLEAPYSSMLHDFVVSKHYIAFVVSPMIHEDERIRNGHAYWHWDSSRRTYIVVIPRHEGVKAARWFTSPITGMQTHSFNAWDEGSVLHLDHCVTETGWLSVFPDVKDPNGKEKPPFGERWSFDLSNPEDSFKTNRFLKHVCEMPMIDRRFAMQRTRHFWFGSNNTALGPMLEWGPKGPPFTCLGHYDETADRMQFYYAGPNSTPEEPVFVPRSADAPEGDGWLLSMVGRRAENRTDLVVLDALHLERGPVATVKFPFRLHEGVHGCYVPAQALGDR